MTSTRLSFSSVLARSASPAEIGAALVAELVSLLGATHGETSADPSAEGVAPHVAVFPVALDTRSFGSVRLHFAALPAIDDAARALAVERAEMAALALDRLATKAAEADARRRLDKLAELTTVLSRALHREEVAQIVVARGKRVGDADTCSLHVGTPNGDALVLLASEGVDPEVLAQIRLISTTSGNPVIGTWKSGTPMWVESYEEYARLYPELSAIATTRPRAQAFWVVPLVAEGATIGILSMGFHRARRFLDDERAFVLTFAGHCAEALRRTERVEAERAALARIDRLRASFETTLRSIGDAVIATDLEGRVTLMNPVAEQLTGWTEREARGVSCGEVFVIVGEETGARPTCPVEGVLVHGRGPELSQGMVLVRRGTGERIPIEDGAAPIKDDTHGAEGVVLVFRDVSAKRAQARRRAFLDRVTAALTDVIDADATVARVAELVVPELADWCSLYVIDEGATLPRQLAVAHVDPTKIDLVRTLNLRYPNDPDAAYGPPAVMRARRPELYPEVTDAMLSQVARDPDHLTMLRALGMRSVAIAPLVSRGRSIGAMTFVHAVSGRRYSPEDVETLEEAARRCATAIDNARLHSAELRARREAVLANRAKDQFLATMSHELRTPLSSIMGWSQLLSSNATPERAMLTRGMEVIHRNTVAMGRLIDDLLDVARITSGKIRLDVRHVDLARVVESAVEARRTGFDDKQIRVTTTLAKDASPFRGDASRLEQVVTNLLTNAMKFTPEGGHVDVRLRRVGDFGEIVVADDGRGIDAAFLPRVFEPFQQAESGVHSGGLGLGLSISRQLVELHGGDISAHSDGAGRGTRFVVRLPLTKTDALLAVAGNTPAPVSPSSLAGITILAVDDDEDARTFVRTVLELGGARVISAASAAEALAALDREQPDLLLSDIGMPQRDGYGLLADIRARPPERGGNLPAIALTAFAYAHDRAQALRAGFAAHVSKPVDANELASIVARVARESRG